MSEKKYQHAEAFCHMKYFGRNRAGQITLSIWNSRDGVTPFMTICKEYGIQLQHVNYQLDLCDENYKPKKGDIIWLSYNEQTATAAAEESYQMHSDFLKDLESLNDEEIRKRFHYDARSHLKEFLADQNEYIKNAVHQMLYAHGEPQPRLELVKEDWK